MKIFNWVHRKFHHKDELGRDVKKAANDSETQALLKHVAIVDVLDGWGEGILTIGTFGFDPLKDFNQQNEEQHEEEDQEYEEEEEEEDSVDNEYCNDIQEDEGELNPLVFKDSHGGEDGVMMVTIDDISRACEVGFGSNNLEYDVRTEKKGERITLADLFSADSEMQTKPHHHPKLHPADSIKIKPPPHAKNGLSFAKKLIPRVREDSHPIQKLHRLMTKMTKRKIHPDVEGKLQNKGSVLGLFKTEHGANESVSLLQTQDVMVCA